MGLKTFINNIRYLARYNIKEMNRRFDEKLDSSNYLDDVIKSLSLQKALSVLNTHHKR